MGLRVLESMMREIRERREWESEQPPRRCPIDATELRLVTDENGQRWYHCPMDNYKVEA